jgi:hypothetical protein
VHGEFDSDGEATSQLLPGFTVNVAGLLQAGQ